MTFQQLEFLDSLYFYTRNKLNNYGIYLHYKQKGSNTGSGSPLKIRHLQIKNWYENKEINFNISFKENYKLYEKELKKWFKELFNI